MNGRPLSPFQNSIRIGHITHGWLAFVTAVFSAVLIFSGNVDELEPALIGLIVYGAAVLYYAKSVKVHRTFERFDKSEALDDTSVLSEGEMRIATLPVFSIIVAVALLLCTVWGLMLSVIGVVTVGEELSRDIRYDGSYKAATVVLFFLSLVTSVSGVCSLVFVVTSIGQRAMKPVDKVLEL